MQHWAFDASVLVRFTIEEANEDTVIVMADIASGNLMGSISTVNVAEFHRAVTKSTSEIRADSLVVWIIESNINIIPLSTEIACIASCKKQKYATSKTPFAWGDAFCLATAIYLGCDVIITTDHEFDAVTEIEVAFV